ncbi:MAG TPA: hypothetical protein VMP42_07755 [Actinomycetota bacterium]|nr:hypothetical protein [Actinomycetota bacterium]
MELRGPGSLSIAMAILAGVACSGGPTSTGSSLVVVDGLTASFESLEVTLVRFNLSWAPADDTPLPPDRHGLVTVLLEITNRTEGMRAVTIGDFDLRTLADDLRTTGPTWSALDHGRTPRLMNATLRPGESTTGWLTYAIPINLLGDQIIWAPVEDHAFAIQLPFGGGRIEEALVFGTALDRSGAPRADVHLTITPVETLPGIPGSETTVGNCTGVRYDAREAVTDEAGTYEVSIASLHASELCVDVLPDSDPDSRVDGVVRPASPTEIMEIPMLRLDLTLDE